MTFFPGQATGVIVLVDRTNATVSAGGTCFTYTRRNVLLTAAHCAPPGVEIYIMLPRENRNRRIVNIYRHPTFDVAVLIAEPADCATAEIPAYQHIEDTLIDGGDFVGFGYPGEGSTGSLPIGRLFKGHVQRYFTYEPPGRSQPYLAAEMSIPAPAGLSGGPLAYAQSQDRPFAIVTTNHDSWATIDSFEEFEKDGKISRGEIRRVVSYGIAILLHGLAQWVHEQIDKPY